MMAWLLKFDGYPPGVIFALLLHAGLLYLMLPSRIEPESFVTVERPAFINATVIKDNPQRLRRLQEVNQQRRDEQAAQQRRDEARARAQQQALEQAELEEAQQQRAETERRQQAEAQQQRADTERKQQAEAQQQRADAERTRQEQAAAEAKRQEDAKQAAAQQQEAQRRQEELVAEQVRQEAARAEAQRQAAAQESESLSTENNMVAEYSAIIHDLISRNWIQSANAKNGMTVVIQLQLVPTGEVVSREVIQSSGDAIFDRSALQAVDRTDSFPELRDMPIAVFERNFRNFTLLFRPEDLLR